MVAFHQFDGKTQFLPSFRSYWLVSKVLISTWSLDRLYRMSLEGYQAEIAL